MRRHGRGRMVVTAAAVATLACALFLAWQLNYVPHPSHSSEELGIERYQSPRDTDADGVDDQTDILESARAYVATRPRYQSRYYAGGWPDDDCGVCTDVVARALLGAGIDLRALVAADVGAHPEAYGIAAPDPDIDFRRTQVLTLYFERNAQVLTTDLSDVAAWQGGDVVMWEGHVGVVSDRRRSDGVPFVIHHWGPLQLRYEEDRLDDWGRIVGHYRLG